MPMPRWAPALSPCFQCCGVSHATDDEIFFQAADLASEFNFILVIPGNSQLSRHVSVLCRPMVVYNLVARHTVRTLHFGPSSHPQVPVLPVSSPHLFGAHGLLADYLALAAIKDTHLQYLAILMLFVKYSQGKGSGGAISGKREP